MIIRIDSIPRIQMRPYILFMFLFSISIGRLGAVVVRLDYFYFVAHVAKRLIAVPDLNE